MSPTLVAAATELRVDVRQVTLATILTPAVTLFLLPIDCPLPYISFPLPPLSSYFLSRPMNRVVSKRVKKEIMLSRAYSTNLL